MSVVIFVGSLYVFITPGFSLFRKTNHSHTWLESLHACIKINMTLASQQNVPNTTFLSPSENEPYWIQKLDITKMFGKENNSDPYNESYSIQINNDNLTDQCTETNVTASCGGQTNDVNNLVQMRYFRQIRNILNMNITYRIGYVNYTTLLNENDSTTMIRCALYYKGEVFSDDCSHTRRAICVENEFLNYAVSKLDWGLPRYTPQHPSSTTGASTPILDTTSYHTHKNSISVTNTSPNNSFVKAVERKAEILYMIIGASVSGVVVLGIVILSCAACLTRRNQINDVSVKQDVTRGKENEGLSFTNAVAIHYLHPNDITLEENTDPKARSPEGESYEILHPYVNSDIEMYSSLKIPKTDKGSETKYENTQIKQLDLLNH